MHNLKAPGPDGFHAFFYKEFWPIVGDLVIDVVISFFTIGCLPKEANCSLIVLIPKTTNLTLWGPFLVGLGYLLR